MILIQNTLKRLNDDILIKDVKSSDLPLVNLINNYKNLSERLTGLEKIDDEQSLGDLKKQIVKLSEVNQTECLTLLLRFKQDEHDFTVPEGSDIISPANFIMGGKNKTWIISRMFFLMFGVMLFIVVTAFVVGTLRGDLDNNFIITGFFNLLKFFTEIFVGSPDPVI